MFKRFDKDSSGTIEFEEFLQTLRVRSCVIVLTVFILRNHGSHP